jgi:hypothetical protein
MECKQKHFAHWENMLCFFTSTGMGYVYTEKLTLQTESRYVCTSLHMQSAMYYSYIDNTNVNAFHIGNSLYFTVRTEETRY